VGARRCEAGVVQNDRTAATQVESQWGDGDEVVDDTAMDQNDVQTNSWSTNISCGNAPHIRETGPLT
jgi:hypothetical protein